MDGVQRLLIVLEAVGRAREVDAVESNGQADAARVVVDVVVAVGEAPACSRLRPAPGPRPTSTRAGDGQTMRSSEMSVGVVMCGGGGIVAPTARGQLGLRAEGGEAFAKDGDGGATLVDASRREEARRASVVEDDGALLGGHLHLPAKRRGLPVVLEAHAGRGKVDGVEGDEEGHLAGRGRGEEDTRRDPPRRAKAWSRARRARSPPAAQLAVRKGGRRVLEREEAFAAQPDLGYQPERRADQVAIVLCCTQPQLGGVERDLREAGRLRIDAQLQVGRDELLAVERDREVLQALGQRRRRADNLSGRDVERLGVVARSVDRAPPAEHGLDPRLGQRVEALAAHGDDGAALAHALGLERRREGGEGGSA